MIKKVKIIKIILLVVIIIGLGVIISPYLAINFNLAQLNLKFNTKIPYPTKSIQCIYDEKAFFGEGDFFTIYEYSDKKSEELKSLGAEVSQSNIHELNEEINYFKEIIKQSNFKYNDKLSLCIIEESDRFFKKINANDNKSYEIILIKTQKNRIEILTHN